MPGPASRKSRGGVAGRLVLIVDDTPDVRELYTSYFVAQGLRVVAAHDGEVGIAAAIQYRPDVIVMDLSMPVLDGVSAIRQLKADPRTRNVPVILVTGYPYKAIEHGALEAGAAVFLTKPCLPEDLERHVQRLIGQPRLHDAA